MCFFIPKYKGDVVAVEEWQAIKMILEGAAETA